MFYNPNFDLCLRRHYVTSSPCSIIYDATSTNEIYE